MKEKLSAQGLRTLRSVLAWGLLALCCILLLSFSAEAAETETGAQEAAGETADAKVEAGGFVTGSNGGPGMTYDAEGRIVSNEEQFEEGEVADSVGTLPAGEAEAAAVAMEAAKAAKAGSEGSTKVEETADGIVYEHDGVRYQKGESWGEHRLTGYSAERNGTLTASGQTARAKHTVAASSALPLGTVLIVEGVSGPNASDYNGVYVVEDRGGAKVEEGLVDIFFQTHAEAAAVTDLGWNTVQVWIAAKA